MESRQGDSQANAECNDGDSVPAPDVPDVPAPDVPDVPAPDVPDVPAPDVPVPEVPRNPMEEELRWQDVISVLLALALFCLIDIVLAIGAPPFVRSLYHGILALYFRKLFLAISKSVRPVDNRLSYIFTALDVACVFIYVYVISYVVNDVVTFCRHQISEKTKYHLSVMLS